jgi:hypothetical protein
MTDGNYSLEIKKLESRYDNKDLVIHAHKYSILVTIFNSSRVEFISSQELPTRTFTTY